jgi:hypothetical protein
MLKNQFYVKLSYAYAIFHIFSKGLSDIDMLLVTEWNNPRQ